jgi:hypothetical protein
LVGQISRGVGTDGKGKLSARATGHHSAYGFGGNLTGKRKTVTAYEGTSRDYVIDARAYEVDPANPAEDAYKTQFIYDALGRVITTIHPPTVVSEGGPDPVLTYTHVHYDSLGRKDWESETTVRSGQPGDEVLESQKKYFELFKVVEIQQTFYQIPEIKTAEKWRHAAPPDLNSP